MTYCWRPSIPNSIDGKPLTTEISDLLWTFPYDRLPSSMAISNFFMRPEVPIGLVLFYLCSPSILRFLCGRDRLNIDGTSNTFRNAVAFHNLSLAIFSLIVFVNSTQVVWSHFQSHGMMSIYCNRIDDGKLWATFTGTSNEDDSDGGDASKPSNGGLGGWAIIFYISKYYEFIDTWILVMKGKKASFLQTYHHAGIVISMWGAIISHSSWILIVVVYNSWIHTLMYSYFFIKTLYPTKQIAAAKYLTQAQILQFITCISYTLYVQVLGNSCESPASRFILAFTQLYGIGLILLFVSFASKKYKQK